MKTLFFLSLLITAVGCGSEKCQAYIGEWACTVSTENSPDTYLALDNHAEECGDYQISYYKYVRTTINYTMDESNINGQIIYRYNGPTPTIVEGTIACVPNHTGQQIIPTTTPNTK
jgi:hypothetical protein